MLSGAGQVPSNQSAAKTVAITGASGTLGMAVTRQFYRKDWDVHLCAANNHSNSWGDVDALDVTKEKAVKKWFREMGGCKAVVTCAGVSTVAPSLDLHAGEWRHVIDVNLTGSFLCAREAVRNGAIRVIFIGSIHGSTPTSYPERAAYTASKAGLVGLTKALAVEWADKGVAVNCVAPGHLPVLMPGTSSGHELLDAAEQATPSGRLSTAYEVASVIYWLANSAPASMTGQILVVSGGFEIDTYPL